MNKQKMRVTYNVEDMITSFVVRDDKDRDLDQANFRFDELPTEGDIADRVSLYGLNKLLTDRTSDEKDKGEKLDKMQGVFALLCTGEWSKERVVGAPVVSVEVEALAFLKEISVPAAQAALAAYNKDVRAKILGSEQVQKAARKLRDVRAEALTTSLEDMIPKEAE